MVYRFHPNQKIGISVNRGAMRGFTLIELLMATLVGAIILSAASSLMLSQLNLNKRTATIERLRETWTHASSFMVSEVAFSEKATSSSSLVSIPSSCDINTSQFRLGLTIRPDLPPVIYGVKASPSMLGGDNTLWRCGPIINNDGTYGSTISLGVIADGLDGSASGGGANATITSAKQVEITLSMKANRSDFFKLSTTAAPRVNPDFLTPREASLCVAANNIADYVGNASANSKTLTAAGLACGGGGGDNLTGSSGDDVLEGGDTGASTLIGGSGDDFIRGTNSNDSLSGGAGDDTLVGRLGNDVLTDSSGTNQFSPGPGNDTIAGGSGLDILYLTMDQSTYSTSTVCDRTSCTLTSTSGNGVKQTTGIEVIIFNDARKDL